MHIGKAVFRHRIPPPAASLKMICGETALAISSVYKDFPFSCTLFRISGRCILGVRPAQQGHRSFPRSPSCRDDRVCYVSSCFTRWLVEGNHACPLLQFTRHLFSRNRTFFDFYWTDVKTGKTPSGLRLTVIPRPAGIFPATSHPISKRSRFITLFHAATKSCVNFSCAPSLP